MKSDELLTLLGVRIRTLRKSKRLTQEHLAELADLNLSYMSEIERGLANVSLCIVNEISNALGMRISDLLDIPGENDSCNDHLTALFRSAQKLDKEKQTIFVEAVKGVLAGLNALNVNRE